VRIGKAIDCIPYITVCHLFFHLFVCCSVYAYNINPLGIFPAILFLYVTVYKSGYASKGAEIWAKITKATKSGDFFLSKKFFNMIFVLRF